MVVGENTQTHPAFVAYMRAAIETAPIRPTGQARQWVDFFVAPTVQIVGIVVVPHRQREPKGHLEYPCVVKTRIFICKCVLVREWSAIILAVNVTRSVSKVVPRYRRID